MGFRFDVYIGSDNGFRRIKRDYLSKVLEWVAYAFPEGYTMLRGRGFYDGVQEDSVVLSFLSDSDIDLREPVTKLKEELGQESVLYSKQNVDLTYI